MVPAMAVIPLSSSEDGFLRALRDDALSTVDVRDGAPTSAGLTQLELEQRVGISRPSIFNLVKHFRPVLGRAGPGTRGGPVALDPDIGVAVGVDVADSHLSIAI